MTEIRGGGGGGLRFKELRTYGLLSFITKCQK